MAQHNPYFCLQFLLFSCWLFFFTDFFSKCYSTTIFSLSSHMRIEISRPFLHKKNKREVNRKNTAFVNTDPIHLNGFCHVIERFSSVRCAVRQWMENAISRLPDVLMLLSCIAIEVLQNTIALHRIQIKKITKFSISFFFISKNK